MPDEPTVKSAAELLGVMDLPTVGRDRLVVTAVELCYRQGFNAVGLDQILAAAGVSKTTFYKHFESKDDLILAAIRLRDAWESEAWGRAVREMGGETPRGQLLAMFDVLDQWFNAPDFGGCMFINAAAEYPNPNDPIHIAAAEHKRATRDWVRGLAEQAGADDPDTFADLYTMILEGTLVMRQVHGRNDAARTARASIEQLLALHLGAGS